MMLLIWLTWSLHASCPGQLQTPLEFVAMRTRASEAAFSPKREKSEALEQVIRQFLPDVYVPSVAPPRAAAKLPRLVFDVKAATPAESADDFKLMVLRLDDLPIALVKVDQGASRPQKQFSFSAVSTTSRDAFVRLREFIFEVYDRPDPWLAGSQIAEMGRWSGGELGLDDTDPRGLSVVPGVELFRLEFADSSSDPTMLNVRQLPDSSYRIHLRRAGHRGERAVDIPANQPAAAVKQTLKLFHNQLYGAMELRVYTNDGRHQPVTMKFDKGIVLTLTDSPATLNAMLDAVSPDHLHKHPEVATIKFERTVDLQRVVEARLRLALEL